LEREPCAAVIRVGKSTAVIVRPVDNERRDSKAGVDNRTDLEEMNAAPEASAGLGYGYRRDGVGRVGTTVPVFPVESVLW
jgi:hypothetical protein